VDSPAEVPEVPLLVSRRGVDEYRLPRWQVQWGRVAFIVLAGSLLHAPVGSAQSQCSAPSRRLTGTDYALLATSTTLLAADWLTTVDYVRRGSRARELNVFLGPRPSVGRLNTYTALSAIANLSVARISKPSLRRAVWIVVSAVETRVVLHNLSIGYQLNFRI